MPTAKNASICAADHDRERPREVGEVLHEVFGVFESQLVGGVVGNRREAEIEEHLGDAALVHEIDDDRREPARLDVLVVLVVDAGAGQIRGKQRHPDQEDDARPGAAQLWLT